MANEKKKVIPGYWFVDTDGNAIPVAGGMNPAMDHVVVDINEREYRARVEGCSKDYVPTEAQKETATDLIEKWIHRHEKGFPAATDYVKVTVGSTQTEKPSDVSVPEMVIELPKGGLSPEIISNADEKIKYGFERIFAAQVKTEKPADNPPAPPAKTEQTEPAKTEKPAENPPAPAKTEQTADNPPAPPAKTEQTEPAKTEKPADNPPAPVKTEKPADNPPAPPAKTEQTADNPPAPAKTEQTEWRYDSSKSPRQNILDRLGAVEGF
ncbi:hypothetical protein IJM16_04405 [Candidatus Saccharibacteria bacterium]|nr:hypothetical protein [Candidatus Saccharibacteria bacterium]